MDRSFYEKEITVRLFQASNALQTYLDKILKSANLTAKQFFMMIIIGTFQYDPKISEIAERFETSHQNAKQVLMKLSNNGYIEFYKDMNDSRITRIRFTEKAKLYWENRNSKDEKTMAELYSELSNEEMNVLLNSLVKTIEKLKDLKW